MLSEGAGEESGLSVEAGVGGVIPNEVVSLRNFRREVELRGDDLIGDVGSETALVRHALALGLG